MHQHHMPGHCAPACHRRPIVCPMQECVVDNYFVENQDYIHPTHILVQNHHLLNNYHYFPYMVSQSNDYQTQEYAFPQGSSPDYNWMEYMQDGISAGGTFNPQMQPVPQGMGQQMPMMGGQPGMMQSPMMGGQPGMMQSPMMGGQSGMMQMPMGMQMGPEEGLME